MKRRNLMSLAAVVFAVSTMVTVAFAAKPGCNSCRKDNCPTGYCYVDCVGCCYNTWNGPVCFR